MLSGKWPMVPFPVLLGSDGQNESNRNMTAMTDTLFFCTVCGCTHIYRRRTYGYYNFSLTASMAINRLIIANNTYHSNF